MSHRLVLLLVFICLGYSAYPQSGQPLWFHSLNAFPNFTPSFNYFVYHDSEDFVWISSSAGLNRYDGTRVKNFVSNPADSTSLFTDDNVQSSFFEDGRKNLWFATANAVHCYHRDSERFRHYKVGGNGEAEMDYQVFFLEKDSFLWLTADTSIYRLNIHDPTQYECIATCDLGFYRVATAADGSVTAIYGLGYLEENGFEYWEIENGELRGRKQWFAGGKPSSAPTQIVDIQTENDTLTWLGTANGVVAWNPKSGKYRQGIEKGFGECLIEPLSDGHLLVWSRKKGLYLFDKNTRGFLPIEIRAIDGSKISTENVFNIYLDKADNLWVSLKGSGLLYVNLKKTKFGAVPKEPAMDGNTSYIYWGGLWDNAGRLWHGSNTDGLFVLDGNGHILKQVKQVPGVASGLPSNWVTSLMQDEKGRIWVGTSAGLTWTDPQLTRFHKVNSKKNGTPFIIDILQTKESAAIYAATAEGIFKVKEQSSTAILEPAIWMQDSYGLLYEDLQGRIYSSRNDRLIDVFHPSKDTLVKIDSLPVKGTVSGFYETSDRKTLWVSTMSGLFKIDLDSLHMLSVFTEKDGLPDKNIHAMLADTGENLWLGTPRGLVVYLNNKGEKGKVNPLFSRFSLADGTQSNEFKFLGAAKRQNGELWFGGANGFTIVPPTYESWMKRPPVVRITDIKINDQPLKAELKDAVSGSTGFSGIKHIVLPFDDNTFSLEFAAIEYSDPSNNYLWYKLDGADNDWVQLKRGEPGFARYVSLREGNYVFMVRAFSSEGIPSEDLKINIKIKPPFHRTWNFYLLLAFLVIGLGWAGIRYRIAQVKERAELKARVAENKMAALRSQMNPHFVFNSLQTVNVFITKQDLRGAIEYVNQFARLMRVILENSRLNAISLENEIELLELYLKTESRRFSQPFTYSITVGNDLDTFSTQIPPMLLQPFVENAIKHGVFHKKEPGHISITFLRENGHLKCAVEDNGVGRLKSAELNEQQGRSHKSRGLEIVKERLDIIWASRSKQSREVKIIDLADLQQNPTGTRVEVILPLF